MNELNYASLEASKKLHKAGIALETDVVRIIYADGTEVLSPREFVRVPPNNPLEIVSIYPTPSMAEVWRELPGFIDNGNHRHRKEIYWDGGLTYCWYGGLVESRFRSKNPADALIELLIFARKEKP